MQAMNTANFSAVSAQETAIFGPVFFGYKRLYVNMLMNAKT
jgi:hypothetical protein